MDMDYITNLGKIMRPQVIYITCSEQFYLQVFHCFLCSGFLSFSKELDLKSHIKKILHNQIKSTFLTIKNRRKALLIILLKVHMCQ